MIQDSGESSSDSEEDGQHAPPSELATAKPTSLDPVAFWTFLKTQTDPMGQEFSDLVKFMEFLMTLPHSSASAERTFSTLKLLRSPLRNRISPETISAVMHVKRFIRCPVHKWVIPPSLLSKSWVQKKPSQNGQNNAPNQSR